MWPLPSRHRSSGSSLPRSETLVESVPRDLDLTLTEARALAHAGQRLALKRLAPPIEADERDEPSLIRCAMNPSGTWRVTVSDAVGLVAVGNLRFLVEPKIPRAHLFHLFARSRLFPRLDATQASAAAGTHLWELMAGWFVEALEHVLRADLVRDYLPFRDALHAARGQIDALATAESYYQGTLELVCDFEDFGDNTPLNRILKAAAVAVGGCPVARRT